MLPLSHWFLWKSGNIILKHPVPVYSVSCKCIWAFQDSAAWCLSPCKLPQEISLMSLVMCSSLLDAGLMTSDTMTEISLVLDPGSPAVNCFSYATSIVSFLMCCCSLVPLSIGALVTPDCIGKNVLLQVLWYPLRAFCFCKKRSQSADMGSVPHVHAIHGNSYFSISMHG